MACGTPRPEVKVECPVCKEAVEVDRTPALGRAGTEPFIKLHGEVLMLHADDGLTRFEAFIECAGSTIRLVDIDKPEPR